MTDSNTNPERAREVLEATVADLRTKLAAATPVPWTVGLQTVIGSIAPAPFDVEYLSDWYDWNQPDGPDFRFVAETTTNTKEGAANAALIAAAMRALPALLDAASERPERETGEVVISVEPWADFNGDLPDYDHPLRCVFESGVQYTVELLAKELGVDDYTPVDGTEEFDGDLGGTLVNIVCASLPADEHGDPMHPRDIHRLATPLPSGGDESQEARVGELEADLAFLLARSGNAGKCMFGGERWTGISSNALVSIAFGEEDRGLPSDSSDLAACYRAVMRLPAHRRTKAVFEHLEVGERHVEDKYAGSIGDARTAAEWPGRAALSGQSEEDHG